jgi:hypothetical protein
MLRCSLLSHTSYLPWPPLFMLSLVTNPFLLVVVSCFLIELYVYCKLLSCDYFASSLRYLLVRWVGQGRISFVGMSVTLCCLRSTTVPGFSPLTSALRRDCVCPASHCNRFILCDLTRRSVDIIPYTFNRECICPWWLTFLLVLMLWSGKNARGSWIYTGSLSA